MNNRLNCLTSDELGIVSETFLECYEAALSLLYAQSRSIVEQKVISFSTETRLYTLFTESALVDVVNFVFEDTVFRDFILKLSNTFFILTSVSDIENNRSLEYTIANGIEIDIVAPTVLIPERILGNINVNITEIDNILSNNKWLTILVLFVLFFTRTSTFATYVKRS